ncbi:hypothetical protein DIPPA_24367 [Diplonema papillatum]|nr:hypothetical protein DIPPA_24367 [Diplonema papillatum]
MRALLAAASLFLPSLRGACDGLVLHRLVAWPGAGSVPVSDDGDWALVVKQYVSPSDGFVVNEFGELEPSALPNPGAVLRKLEAFDWSSYAQAASGQFTLRLSYPLNPEIHPLTWRQTSPPTAYHVTGYQPVDVRYTGVGDSRFVGLRRARHGVPTFQSKPASILDGCVAQCGYPSVEEAAPGQRHLRGPCRADNRTTLWTPAASEADPPTAGCTLVLAVELWVARPDEPEFRRREDTKRIRAISSSCRLGDWIYAGTNAGLARAPADGSAGLSVLELGDGLCEVGGYAIRISCNEGVAAGVARSALADCAADAAGVTGINATGAGYEVADGHRAAPKGLSDFTVTAWLKPNEWNTTEGDDVVLSLNGVVVRVLYATGTATLAFEINDLYFGPQNATRSSLLHEMERSEAEEWRHYAFVRSAAVDDSGNEQSTLRLFVDGRLAAEGAGLRPVSLSSLSPRGIVASFHGMIDDVRVFPTRAITLPELERLSSCPFDTAPVSAVYCDEQGLVDTGPVVLYSPGRGAPHGACRIRAYAPGSGASFRVAPSCPGFWAGAAGAGARRWLHSFAPAAAVFRSGVDLVLTGSPLGVLVLPPRPTAGAAVRGVSVPGGAAACAGCGSAGGLLYLVCEAAFPDGVVSVRGLHSRDGGPYFTPVLRAPEQKPWILPVTCAATEASLFVGDAAGVVQIDISSRRGARVVGSGGAAPAQAWPLPSNGGDARRAALSRVLHVSVGAGPDLLVVAGGGGVFRVPAAKSDEAALLVFGQSAGAGVAAADPGDDRWLLAGEQVQPAPPAVIAEVQGGWTSCVDECNGIAGCTGFVWMQGSLSCTLATVASNESLVADANAGGSYYARPAASRAPFVPPAELRTGAARLEDALLAGLLTVAPHAVCELGAHLYVLGGHRLLRVDLATSHVEFLAGRGVASLPPTPDGPISAEDTVLVDGPLACHPGGWLLVGQMVHGCVRKVHVSGSLRMETVAGTCGAVAGGGAVGYEGRGWVSSRTAIGPPTSLSLNRYDDVVYIATPTQRAVWQCDLGNQRMRRVLGNGTAASDPSTVADRTSGGWNGTELALMQPTSVLRLGTLLGGDAIVVFDSFAAAPGLLLKVEFPRSFRGDPTVSLLSGAGAGTAGLATGTDRALAGVGEVAPPSEAQLFGTAKASSALVGGRAYFPRPVTAVGLPRDAALGSLQSVDASGALSAYPRFGAAVEGQTVAASADGASLLLGGHTGGGLGAVWRLSGVPGGATKLGGASLASQDFAANPAFFGADLFVRFDEPLGRGNWTAVVSLGHGALAAGILDEGDGAAVFLRVNRDVTPAVPTTLADGLWHRLQVAWSAAGGWSISVDGARVAGGVGLSVGVQLEGVHPFVIGSYGLHADDWRPDLLLTPPYFSAALASVRTDPRVVAASWALSGHLDDGTGSYPLHAEPLGVAEATTGPERGRPVVEGNGAASFSAELGGEGTVLMNGARWREAGPCRRSVQLDGKLQRASLGPMPSSLESGSLPSLTLAAWLRPALSRHADEAIVSAGNFVLYSNSRQMVSTALATANGVATHVCSAEASRLARHEWTHASAHFDLIARSVTISVNGLQTTECRLPASDSATANAPPHMTAGAVHLGDGFAWHFEGSISNAVATEVVPGGRPAACGPCVPGALRGARGVNGATFYKDSLRLDAGRKQFAAAAPAAAAGGPSFERGAIRAWVRPESGGAADALLYGAEGGLPAAAARYCTQGVAGSPVNASGETGAGGGFEDGGQCVATDQATAEGRWHPESTVSAWFRIPDAVGSWVQPLLRWSSPDDETSFTLSFGPLGSDAASALSGQWCVSPESPLADIGPFALPLAHMSAGYSGAATISPIPAAPPGQRTPGRYLTREPHACVFDASASPLALLPPAAPFNTSQLSVAAWVHVDLPEHSPTPVTVVEAFRDGSGAPVLSLTVQDCHVQSQRCVAAVSLRTGDGYVSVQSYSVFALRRWTHVAAVYSPSEILLFLDGQLAANRRFRSDAATGTSGVSSYYFGGSPARRRGAAALMLHDLRLYGAAAPAAEIAAIAHRREAFGVQLAWKLAAEPTHHTCPAPAAPWQSRKPPDPGAWHRLTAVWDETVAAVYEHTANEPSEAGALAAECALAEHVLVALAEDLRVLRLLPLETSRVALRDVSVLPFASPAAAAPVFSARGWRVSLQATAAPPPAAGHLGLALTRCGRPASVCPALLLAENQWTLVEVAWDPAGTAWRKDGELVCSSADTLWPAAHCRADAAGAAFVGGSPVGGFFNGYLHRVEAVASSDHLAPDAPAGAEPGLLMRLPLRHDGRDATCHFRSTLAGEGAAHTSDPSDCFESAAFNADWGCRLELNGWWGVAGASAGSLSVWVKRRQGPSPGLPVVLGSSREDGAKWSVGSGARWAGGSTGGAGGLVLYFDFEGVEPWASPADLCGGLGNNATRVAGARLAPGAGVRNTTAALLPEDALSAVMALSQETAAAGLGEGLTVAFWMRVESTGSGTATRPTAPDAFSSPSHGVPEASPTRVALFEVLRESPDLTSDSGKAFVACLSTDQRHVHFALATPAGLFGPPTDAQHFRQGAWQHVAVSIAAEAGAVRMYSEGRLLWSGSGGNVSSAWRWGLEAVVLGHYAGGDGYVVTEGSSCGTPAAAFEHPMPDGSNSTFLEGAAAECRRRCDAYEACAGFVYIHPGDEAPPARCYFRTDIRAATATDTRDCHAKARRGGESARVLVDELAVFDRVLPGDRIRELAAGGVAEGGAIPAQEVVFAVDFAGGGAGGAAIFEWPDDSGAGRRAALHGIRQSSGGAAVSGDLPASISSLENCGAFAADVGFDAGPGVQAGDVIATIPEAVVPPSRDVIVRVLASNPGSLPLVVTVNGFLSVVIPPLANRVWAYNRAYCPDVSAAAMTIVHGPLHPRTDTNATLHSIELCPKVTPAELEAECRPWLCSCRRLSNYYGMSPSSAGCAPTVDAAARAWWDARSCATGPAHAGPFAGCSVPRHAWTVAFSVRAERPPLGAAGAPEFPAAAAGLNCSAAYELARAASPVTAATWQWWLCTGSTGLYVHSTVGGQLTEAWYSDADNPAIPYDTWTKIAVVIDGTERRLYRDGVLVHTHVSAGSAAYMVRWDASAEFFVSVQNATVPLLLGHVALIHGAYSAQSYRTLAADGLASIGAPDGPCPLQQYEHAADHSVWALYRFNDGWQSGERRVAADSGGKGRHLTVASDDDGDDLPCCGAAAPGALGDASGGAAWAAGPRGLRQGELMQSNRVSVAFWVNVIAAGRPSAGALQRAASAKVCEARACGVPAAADVLRAEANVTSAVCAGLCQGSPRCESAHWLAATPGAPSACTISGTPYPSLSASFAGGLIYRRSPAGAVELACSSLQGGACSYIPDEGASRFDDLTLDECRSRCRETKCRVAEWQGDEPSTGRCVLAPSMLDEPRVVRVATTTFVADEEPAFNINIFRTDDAPRAQQLLVGEANEKVVLAFRTGAANGTDIGTVFQEQALSLRRWHHVVFVHEGSTAFVVVDGVVDGPSISLDALHPSGRWPEVVWSSSNEWLSALDSTAHALFDDVATWDRALSRQQAADVYGKAVRDNVLTPGLWQHLSWTMGSSGQRWYVDGKQRSFCRASAPIRSRGSKLLVGSHASASFAGQMLELRLHNHELSAAEVRRLATDFNSAPTVDTVGADESDHWSHVWSQPSHANLDEETSACGRCSKNCDDVCHTSTYDFDDVDGSIIADMSGNGRHARKLGLAVDHHGVLGSNAIQNVFGGYVALSSSSYPNQWSSSMSGAGQVSWMAWVRPLAIVCTISY